MERLHTGKGGFECGRPHGPPAPVSGEDSTAYQHNPRCATARARRHGAAPWACAVAATAALSASAAVAAEVPLCCPAAASSAGPAPFWGHILDTGDFPPRWQCGNWSAGLGWLHIVSDLLIWLAYVLIPVALIYFARKRPDVPFKRIFPLFGAFIIACGTTHLLDATMFYYPAYRLLGLIKLGTAIISLTTVVVLVPLIPKALSLPSAKDMAREVAERVRAEDASRAKSSFLAVMSHEIRTPLTAILGFAQTIRDEGQTIEERRAAADTIVRNGAQLLAVLNDVLDLSRIEADRLEIRKTRLSPWRDILDVVNLVRPRAEQKAVALDVEFLTPVPAQIETDPVRLGQVLTNLLGNAVKFTDRGSVRLEISYRTPLEGGPRLIFDVIDTGIGIDPEEARRLFQPFTQVDANMTRRFGGSGLGLHISRRLAGLLGGDVWIVESQRGRGSIFRATVDPGPIENVAMLTPAQVLREPVSPPSAHTAEAHRRLARLRVLLVEDSPDNQRLISHILRKAGASVTLAENGRLGVEEALAAGNDGRPYDVIIMDMQMPVMDGYQATRVLRARRLEGPIIALTANAMAGDRQKCLDAGCDEFCTKPVDRSALVNLVAAIVSRHAPAGSK